MGLFWYPAGYGAHRIGGEKGALEPELERPDAAPLGWPGVDWWGLRALGSRDELVARLRYLIELRGKSVARVEKELGRSRGFLGDALRDVLRRAYTPLTGFCIMLFCLISAPCIATVAVTRRESESWSWALLQFGGFAFMPFALLVLAGKGDAASAPLWIGQGTAAVAGQSTAAILDELVDSGLDVAAVTRSTPIAAITWRVACTGPSRSRTTGYRSASRTRSASQIISRRGSTARSSPTCAVSGGTRR